MIEIKVHDYRGCRSAELQCAPLAVVAGKNAAAKSSIAQAAAAALSGVALPEGLPSKRAAELVRQGAAAGWAEIVGARGAVRLGWPAGESRSSGTAPQASLYAVMSNSLATDTVRERANVLGSYLRADPDRGEFIDACTAEGIGEQTAGQLWETIVAEGWDAAAQRRRDRGVEMKALWRNATGINWGSRIGASWAPGTWSEDLAELTEGQLTQAVAAAEEEYRQQFAKRAVGAADRQRLEAEAAGREKAESAQNSAQQALADVEAGLAAVRAERAEIGPTEKEMLVHCLECGAVHAWRRDGRGGMEWVRAENLEEPELRARRRAIADADGRIANLEGAKLNAYNLLNTARTAVEVAGRAEARLAELPEAGAPQEPPDDTALVAAQARLAAWKAKTTADRYHLQIAANDRVMKLMLPDGLRGQKLGARLAVFNHDLEEFCANAGWRPVAVDAAMTLSYDGRPYSLLSESERWRVRAVLALALGRLDGSDLVIFDGADILDAPTRSGLFNMLLEAGTPALVCLTLSTPQQVPVLALVENDAHAYWIEEGETRELVVEREAA